MLIGAASTTAAGVPAESAPQGKEVVVLGDSFTANSWDPLSTQQRCERGWTAWPAQLNRLLGAHGSDRMTDMSCPGASIDSGPGYTLTVETRDAAAAGAFGPRTRLVTLQFGLNDRWDDSGQSLWDAMRHCVFDLAHGCGLDAVAESRLPDPDAVTGAAYAERIRQVVTYIRYYAPAARIVLIGYPELARTGQDTICLDFFGLIPFIQPRGRTAVEYFDRIDRAQREGAELLRLDFLDARALTAGHGLCSTQPWVNGVFNPSIDIGGLPFHPSPEGDAVVANALYERFLR